MEIIIKEKQRMTKEEFMAKWGYNSQGCHNKEFKSDLDGLLGEQREEKIEYPCLMVSNDGLIISAKEKCKNDNLLRGIVVKPIGNEYEFGDENTYRDATQFKPFHGEVIIRQ